MIPTPLYVKTVCPSTLGVIKWNGLHNDIAFSAPKNCMSQHTGHHKVEMGQDMVPPESHGNRYVTAQWP